MDRLQHLVPACGGRDDFSGSSVQTKDYDCSLWSMTKRLMAETHMPSTRDW
ncbi:hypothetical protein X772_24650 [Mesorhizobium sp. LSJC280B00]|nr:hypothetical protein X772_24650 [Mesorhizobium sp. LSJC280B00]